MIKAGIIVFSLVLCSVFVYLIDFEKSYFEKTAFEKTYSKMRSLMRFFVLSEERYIEISAPFSFNISVKNNQLFFESEKFYAVSKISGINDSSVAGTSIFSINKTRDGVFLCMI